MDLHLYVHGVTDPALTAQLGRIESTLQGLIAMDTKAAAALARIDAATTKIGSNLVTIAGTIRDLKTGTDDALDAALEARAEAIEAQASASTAIATPSDPDAHVAAAVTDPTVVAAAAQTVGATGGPAE